MCGSKKILKYDFVKYYTDQTFNSVSDRENSKQSYLKLFLYIKKYWTRKNKVESTFVRWIDQILKSYTFYRVTWLYYWLKK